MTLTTCFYQALNNLLAAKLRSFLAVLGILVGTAAVVALLSCGKLASEKALQQFKSLGTDLLSISIYQKTGKQQPQAQLSIKDWRRLPDKIAGIALIAPYSTSYQPIIFQGKKFTGSIIGADESLARIIKIQQDTGRFVSFVETFEHTCVIGHDLAQDIKATELASPIGKQIQIGKTLFTIIGVASSWQENGFFNEDINRAVIIPLTSMTLVNKNTAINHAILRLKNSAPIKQVIADLKQTIQPHMPHANIFIRSAKQIIASMESQAQIFTILLAVIGSISLLVGGIGIMNVMLVAVSERKKEIGIRKAIGATNRDIQMLFLFESAILAVLGGMLGICLGLIVTLLIAYFNQWPFAFYAFPTMAGFVVSATTGIFFGFYPARRASRLDPITSLRASQ